MRGDEAVGAGDEDERVGGQDGVVDGEEVSWRGRRGGDGGFHGEGSWRAVLGLWGVLGNGGVGGGGFWME